MLSDILWLIVVDEKRVRGESIKIILKFTHAARMGFRIFFAVE